jgi:hypothetical protein
MWIKTELRYYCINIRTCKVKNSDNTKCRKVCGEFVIFMHFWWKTKMIQLLWKTIYQVLIKLDMQFPYDPAIILTDTYPREMKTCFHAKICAYMFVVAFLIIAPNWNNRCPSVDECCNRGTFIPTNISHHYRGKLYIWRNKSVLPVLGLGGVVKKCPEILPVNGKSDSFLAHHEGSWPTPLSQKTG